MDIKIASGSACFADRTSLQEQASSLRHSAGTIILRFSKRASIVAALLLSLGLWAVIWAVVASLASAILG
jgi:hypothetical protein